MCAADLEHSPAGIYIHIPFCRSKCDYCSFNSLALRDHDLQAYTEALLLQAERMAARIEADLAAGKMATAGKKIDDETITIMGKKMKCEVRCEG